MMKCKFKHLHVFPSLLSSCLSFHLALSMCPLLVIVGIISVIAANLSGNLIQTKSCRDKSAIITQTFVSRTLLLSGSCSSNYTAVTSSFDDLILLCPSMPSSACLNATSTATHDDIIILGQTANEDPQGGESITGHRNNAGQSARAKKARNHGD